MRSVKRAACILTLIVLTLSLCSCGNSEKEAENTEVDSLQQMMEDFEETAEDVDGDASEESDGEAKDGEVSKEAEKAYYDMLEEINEN